MKFAIYILICIALAIIFVPEQIGDGLGAILLLGGIAIGIIIFTIFKKKK
jgi:hypothetical protein